MIRRPPRFKRTGTLVSSTSLFRFLRSIARFTQSRWGLRQRNVYLREVDLVFRSLAKNPLMGRACDEVREGYRKLPHGAHVIYYKPVGRSEEHTSELQSLMRTSYAVFRLKKKNRKRT